MTQITPIINGDFSPLEKFDLIYVGSPYTKYKRGINQAAKTVGRITGKLMLRGLKVVSPIAHTHPIAKAAEMNPLDHDLWLPIDRALMDKSDALLICKMDGWEESFGLGVEIEVFTTQNKPIFSFDPIEARLTPRKDAKNKGLKVYDGRPCKRCGDKEKYVSGFTCVTCGHKQRYKKLGLVDGQYERMLEEQNYQCKVCKTLDSDCPGEKLHVDHCHTTGRVRGLLCSRCNLALGLMKDDIKRIKNLAEYLRYIE